jgi:hypothetical protein
MRLPMKGYKNVPIIPVIAPAAMATPIIDSFIPCV